jgi:hypothetical protein
MHILGTIETWWTARTDTIFAQSLNRLLFQCLVADEVVEIVGSEVGDYFAASICSCDPALWSGCADDGRSLLVFDKLLCGLRLDEWLWLPFFD